MFGRDISKQIQFNPDNNDFSVEDMTSRVKYLASVMQRYWKRFSTSYLNELRQFHIYNQQKVTSNHKVYKGDVVLIKDDNPQPRNKWKKGVIDDIVVGRDNKPRGVKLFVITQTGQRRSCYRPLQKIIPFEISNQCNPVNSDAAVKIDVSPPLSCEVGDSDIGKLDENQTEERSRPKRKTADQGQELRRLKDRYY